MIHQSRALRACDCDRALSLPAAAGPGPILVTFGAPNSSAATAECVILIFSTLLPRRTTVHICAALTSCSCSVGVHPYHLTSQTFPLETDKGFELV